MKSVAKMQHVFTQEHYPQDNLMQIIRVTKHEYLISSVSSLQQVLLNAQKQPTQKSHPNKVALALSKKKKINA